MNNPKPGVVVTLRGDTDFIGVIIHGRQVVMVEPYKLERFKPRTKA